MKYEKYSDSEPSSLPYIVYFFNIWVKEFKNGPSKICGRQTLQKMWSDMVWLGRFNKFYLAHSWIPWPIFLKSQKFFHSLGLAWEIYRQFLVNFSSQSAFMQVTDQRATRTMQNLFSVSLLTSFHFHQFVYRNIIWNTC